MSTLGNGSNPVKMLIMVMLVSLLSTASLAYQLPDFDVRQSATDRRQGVNFLRAIWRTGLVTHDIEDALYLRRLGQKIAAFSSHPNKHFDFFLIDSSQINAFAGHYGYIGFFTGLVMATTSETELAGVMAHEISHITQNHLTRYQQSAGLNNYLLLAGILTAMITGGSAGHALLSTTVAGVTQSGIDFTREQEWEADRIGIDLLVKSGFSAVGMAQFFRKLLAIDSQQTLEFLRTHPLSINRVAEAEQRATAYKEGTVTSFPYEITRAKLRYIHHNDLDGQNRSGVEQYMKAWIAFNQEDYVKAKQHINVLFAENKSAPVKILRARIVAKTAQLADSVNLLTEVLRDDPTNEAAAYYLAEVYEDDNQLENAIKQLRNFIRNNDVMSYSYEKLAALYLKNKQLLRHHLSMADVFYQKAEFIKAKQQLNQAQNHVNNEYFMARIKARLTEVDKLIGYFSD